MCSALSNLSLGTIIFGFPKPGYISPKIMEENFEVSEDLEYAEKSIF
jgi:hypothetical protein